MKTLQEEWRATTDNVPLEAIVIQLGEDERSLVIVSNKAKADLVCRALNCHNELVEALKQMIAAYGPNSLDWPGNKLSAWDAAKTAIANVIH